jgi:hypothetical protein
MDTCERFSLRRLAPARQVYSHPPSSLMPPLPTFHSSDKLHMLLPSHLKHFLEWYGPLWDQSTGTAEACGRILKKLYLFVSAHSPAPVTAPPPPPPPLSAHSSPQIFPCALAARQTATPSTLAVRWRSASTRTTLPTSFYHGCLRRVPPAGVPAPAPRCSVGCQCPRRNLRLPTLLSFRPAHPVFTATSQSRPFLLPHFHLRGQRRGQWGRRCQPLQTAPPSLRGPARQSLPGRAR